MLLRKSLSMKKELRPQLVVILCCSEQQLGLFSDTILLPYPRLIHSSSVPQARSQQQQNTLGLEHRYSASPAVYQMAEHDVWLHCDAGDQVWDT